MRLWIVAFLLGVCSVQVLHKLPAIYFNWLLLIISVISSVYFKRNYYVLLFFASCGGLAWVLLNASWQLSQLLPKQLEGKTLVLTGTIISIPKVNGSDLQFEVMAKKIDAYPLATRVHLSWHNRKPPLLWIGDEWQWQVRLQRPHGTLNPGCMDMEKVFMQRGIQATGYVIPKFPFKKLAIHQGHALDRFRQYLFYKMQKVLHGDAANILPALTVGITHAISARQWQVLRNTGTNHLVAISGLHIGLIAMLAFSISGWIWRQFPNLPLYLPATKIATMTALLSAVIYSGLAGFALPTQRALMMLLVGLAAIYLFHPLKPWGAWCLALLGVLLLNPLASLSMSFCLSFMAVASIIFGVSGRVKAGHKAQWLHTQWSVTLGLLPLLLWFFQQISWLSLLANSIAIPWVSFIVVPLSLLGTLGLLLQVDLGSGLLWLAAKAMAGLWYLLDYLAGFEALQWHIFLEPGWIMVSLVIAIVLSLAPPGIPGRTMGVLYLLPILLCKPALPEVGHVWLTLLDVGQGLAAVVQTQHHILVYDSGAHYRNGYDLGAAVVLPYLHSLTINSVDSLVISHADNDHSGGAHAILKGIAVKQLITSVPEYFPEFPAQFCHQGLAWQWDGVKFQFIYPPQGDLSHLKRNDQSCVLQVIAKGRVLLLPGDIQRQAERMLLMTVAKNRLASDIIIVPHHGSRTSSTLAFIQAIRPNYALFAVGYHNRYKLPKLQIVQRYQKLGSKTLDTSQCGAIIFTDKLAPDCYRDSHRHVWNR